MRIEGRHYYRLKVIPSGVIESTITMKGQATIPKAIRDHLRLKPGDRVKFFVHPNGSVVLLPRIPVSALRGILKSPRHKPVTLGEMEKAIAAGASEGFARLRKK